MAAADHLHPEQLKMFMSAREILSDYDPHEGDRVYKGTQIPSTWAARPSRLNNETGDFELAPPETNDEMWQRKLEESKDPRRGTGGKSHYEHLQEHGVEDPIPLTFFPNPLKEGSTRPMVGGGQHRIAAMNEIDPDRLMPVVHHKNILTAKDDPHYPYR